jgi:hypothetical protein
MPSPSTLDADQSAKRPGRFMGALRVLCLAFVPTLAVVISGCTESTVNGGIEKNAQTAPDTKGSSYRTAYDLDGRPFDPFAAREGDVVVLVFVGIDCPISNRYAPEVRRLCEHFASRAVSFWVVQPDPDVSGQEVRRHLKEFNYPCDALRDPLHVLVQKAQATRVPECAVFDFGGKLVYHGRINNRYADYGRARQEATEHDLRDAIEAVLDGRKPARASVPAVGCHIPDLP